MRFPLLLLVLAASLFSVAHAEFDWGSPCTGYLNVANTTHAVGWACDSDALNRSLRVHIRIDGKDVAIVRANRTREAAVARACGGIAARGFMYKFPSRLVQLLGDGNAHQVAAFAEDIPTGTLVQMFRSPKKVQNTLPRGVLDMANATMAAGWACDPEAPEYPIYVSVFVDEKFVGLVLANGTREQAVGLACGSASSSHGFAFLFPSEVAAVLSNGHVHRIEIDAVNFPAGINPQLTGSPKDIQVLLPPPPRSSIPSTTTSTATTDTTTAASSEQAASMLPKGNLDTVTADGVAGWVCDPKDYTKGLLVYLFVDGMLTAEVAAKRTREDVVADQCGGFANHGFTFSWQGRLPYYLRDGRPHKIEAFVLDALTDKLVRLSGTPRMVIN